MQDFSQLLTQYGWHAALIGLLGTIIVGLLKRPLSAAIAIKFPPATNPIKAEQFDAIAFLLAFCVAVVLAVGYLIVTKVAGLRVPSDSLLTEATFYGTNVLGVWMFQTIYYQVWKKAGLKSVIEISWSAIKARLFKKGTSSVDFVVAATQSVQRIFSSGKLNVADTLSAAAPLVEDIVSQLTAEAGGDAQVSAKKNVDTLAWSVEAIVPTVSKEEVTAVAQAVDDFVAQSRISVVVPSGLVDFEAASSDPNSTQAKVVVRSGVKSVKKPIVKF